ncbi:replication-relaxation family protein [Actinoplanes sp. NPDC051470]|uniref:replication-relaxation family protein n=1 Tax=Actinoplanes sp. NPDC051470 TaxID=3157224 RepID=UPI00342318D3
MARQYRVGPNESTFGPPVRRPGGVQVHGLGERHWSLLGLLAEHGALHTGQVVTLLFGSRPAAVRHLGALFRAGLVWRFVYDDDPSHLAYYEASTDGVTVLEERLHRSGHAVPPVLAQPVAGHLLINDFFTGLAAEARTNQHGCLYRWQRAADTAAWLRGYGVSGVRPRAYGVWIEDGIVVRFLLHIDHGEPKPWSGDPAPPPAEGLAGYRLAERGVPATAVLVVHARPEREADLHRELAAAPVPVPVATCTLDRLYAAPSAADAIWNVAGADDTFVRLIDVPRR